MIKGDSHHDWFSLYDNTEIFYLNARNIPTVDEIQEYLTPLYNDIIHQVTTGHARYYGYEIEHDFDNEIAEPALLTKTQPVRRVIKNPRPKYYRKLYNVLLRAKNDPDTAHKLAMQLLTKREN